MIPFFGCYGVKINSINIFRLVMNRQMKRRKKEFQVRRTMKLKTKRERRKPMKMRTAKEEQKTKLRIKTAIVQYFDAIDNK